MSTSSEGVESYISLGYIRVTLAPGLSRLPSSYLDVLRPRGWGVSCTLRLRCCWWRYVRFETGVVCSVASGDGLIQLAGGCLAWCMEARGLAVEVYRAWGKGGVVRRVAAGEGGVGDETKAKDKGGCVMRVVTTARERIRLVPGAQQTQGRDVRTGALGVLPALSSVHSEPPADLSSRAECAGLGASRGTPCRKPCSGCCGRERGESGTRTELYVYLSLQSVEICRVCKCSSCISSVDSPEGHCAPSAPPLSELLSPKIAGPACDRHAVFTIPEAADCLQRGRPTLCVKMDSCIRLRAKHSAPAT